LLAGYGQADAGVDAHSKTAAASLSTQSSNSIDLLLLSGNAPLNEQLSPS
jgi:hypothetical protein